MVGNAGLDDESYSFGTVSWDNGGEAGAVGVVGFGHEDGEEAVGEFVFLLKKKSFILKVAPIKDENTLNIKIWTDK